MSAAIVSPVVGSARGPLGDLSVIGLLRHAIRIWRLRAGASREAIALHIMAMHETLGLAGAAGADFRPLAEMPARDVRRHTERIFGWLDDDGKDDALLPLNSLPAVLAALPLDLRLLVAEALLGAAGLRVEVRSADENALCMGRLLRRVLRENAQAADLMAQAAHDPDAMRGALRALCRGIAAMQDAAAAIEAMESEMASPDGAPDVG